MINWIEKNTGWFIVIILSISVIAPWVLTRSNFIGIDFSTTGDIGDTIGGITAPFLNFLGIILLYLTLKKQNSDFKNQRDYENLSNLFNIIREDLEKISIVKSTDAPIKGLECLSTIKKILDETKNIPYLDNERGLSTFFNSGNLEIFFTNYNFLIFNIKKLLYRNLKSSLSIGEKIELYNDLTRLIRPIIRFNSSLVNYWSSQKGSNKHEFLNLMEQYYPDFLETISKYRPIA